MTRSEAIGAYVRVRDWQAAASCRLVVEMRARGACDPVPLTLHNWGRCGGREPYKTLDREYRHRQGEIWERAERLSRAFARYF